MGDARKLALAPADWFWATWRDLKPLRLPKAAPFDRAATLERLRKQSDEVWEWGLKAPRAMEPEEGLFWLGALGAATREVGDRPDRRPFADRLKSAEPPEAPEDPLELIVSSRYWIRHGVWTPLRAVYPAARILDAFIRAESHRTLGRHWYQYYALESVVRGFWCSVRPYLDAAEVDACREAVAPHVKRLRWSPIPNDEPPVALLLAAALGLHDLVRPYVEQVSGEPPHRMLELIFGLSSAGEVESHVRRLKLRLAEPELARAWLAHTEFGALDWLGDSIIAQKRSGDANPLAKVLALAHGPETAPVMLEVMQKSRAKQAALKWLEGNPEHTADGLVSMCVQRGRVLESAVQVLRSLHAGKHARVVEAALAEAGPVGERLRDAVAGTRQDRLEEFDPRTLPPELWGHFRAAPAPVPKFLQGQELPPLVIAGKSLSEAQLAVVLTALQDSTLDRRHPLVTGLPEHLEPLSRDRFALRLLELWMWAGMPRKEAWALTAAGLWGGDACAMRLGPLAIEWRKKLVHQAAKDAVECLRAIGSDTALLQLRNFTMVPRDWSLKEVASQHLDEAAKARGLTRAELEERMVPDCGLDPAGGKTFDFGPRRFTLILGENLKPMVRDEAGKRMADLPKPGAKDDAALAGEAVAAWKLLKKQLAEVLKLQGARLERAMVRQEGWAPDDFEKLVVRHPVMTLLAQRLVWGTYDEPGGLTGTFRVAEDQSLAGPADEPFSTGGASAIRVAHPLCLAPEVLAQWGERFSDYEITPPFPQLGRPVFRPEPSEAASTEITRFDQIPCKGVALMGGLERRGWTRGDIEEGICSYEFSRSLADGTFARLQHSPGLPLFEPQTAPDQTIDRVTFQREGRLVPLGQVEPVLYSEVLADLHALTAHGM